MRLIGVTVSLVGALLGGLASAVRTGSVGDGGWGTGTYLIDAVAILLCVAGVAIEARAVARLANYFDLRRGAIVQFFAGVALAMATCLLIPAMRSSDPPGWAQAGLATLVYLGAGRGLSGAATLAITVAPDYLERRIDDGLEEPW